MSTQHLQYIEIEMNNQTPTFGQIVKRYYPDIGLTQDELARRAGYTSGTLPKIAHGDLRPSVHISKPCISTESNLT
jgi:DNA-binding XRE family transcriptional regulator